MHHILVLVLLILPYFILGESQYVAFWLTGTKSHHTQVTLNDQKTIVVSSSFMGTANKIDIIRFDPDDYMNTTYFLGVKSKETRNVRPNTGNTGLCFFLSDLILFYFKIYY
jgi:hypothetical protein